jgi:hypothetical protein
LSFGAGVSLLKFLPCVWCLGRDSVTTAGIGGIVEKDDFLKATTTAGTMAILARVVDKDDTRGAPLATNRFQYGTLPDLCPGSSHAA